jgi:hypothetical protein
MSGTAESAAAGGEGDLMTGIHVSGGLHIRLLAEGELRRAAWSPEPGAAWSPEPGVNPRAEVEREIARLRQRLDDLLAWLIQYRRDHGEVMERPDS